MEKIEGEEYQVFFLRNKRVSTRYTKNTRRQSIKNFKSFGRVLIMKLYKNDHC